MSTGTGIEWTSATWNPVVGCTRASAGCDRCYAVKQTYRLERMGQAKYAGLTVLNGKGSRHFNGVVRTVESALAIPLGWKKPRRIFVNSMSDLFHKDVPEEFIDRVFAVMALCPQHTFQVLTKRPERMAAYLRGDGRCARILHATLRLGMDVSEVAATGCVHNPWPLPNVWLGTSVEDQRAADERIPHLLKCPAAIRFLSVEPLLGEVDLDAYVCGECGKLFASRQSMKAMKVKCPHCEHCDEYTEPHHRHILNQRLTMSASSLRDVEDGSDLMEPRIHWVIVGGESGHGARYCDLDWIRKVVERCAAASTPCFVKQIGAQPTWNGMGLVANNPKCSTSWESVNRKQVLVLSPSDRKGGDPSEWPEDLRVRQFPKQDQPQLFAAAAAQPKGARP